MFTKIAGCLLLFKLDAIKGGNEVEVQNNGLPQWRKLLEAKYEAQNGSIGKITELASR